MPTRKPIWIESHPSRQPIRIEHYVTRELSARVGDSSRLSVWAIAYLNTRGRPPPLPHPPHTWSANTVTTAVWKQITPEMNWSNRHIDPVKPSFPFKVYIEEDSKEASNGRNIQNFLQEDNLQKDRKVNLLA